MQYESTAQRKGGSSTRCEKCLESSKKKRFLGGVHSSLCAARTIALVASRLPRIYTRGVVRLCVYLEKRAKREFSKRIASHMPRWQKCIEKERRWFGLARVKAPLPPQSHILIKPSQPAVKQREAMRLCQIASIQTPSCAFNVRMFFCVFQFQIQSLPSQSPESMNWPSAENPGLMAYPEHRCPLNCLRPWNLNLPRAS